MAFKQKSCTHLAAISEVKNAVKQVCETCVEIGGTWVHLRTCQSCGITLCCDSSPNKHARKHAKRNDHHVIASAEPGEQWLYCFEDDVTITY